MCCSNDKIRCNSVKAFWGFQGLFFFWLNPHHMKVPGPAEIEQEPKLCNRGCATHFAGLRIQPASPQWPEPLQLDPQPTVPQHNSSRFRIKKKKKKVIQQVTAIPIQMIIFKDVLSGKYFFRKPLDYCHSQLLHLQGSCHLEWIYTLTIHFWVLKLSGSTVYKAEKHPNI